MNRVNRVKIDDNYDTSDWYSASRDSTAVSIIPENAHMVMHQSTYGEGHSQRQKTQMNAFNSQREPTWRYDTYQGQHETVAPLDYYMDSARSMHSFSSTQNNSASGSRREHREQGPRYEEPIRSNHYPENDAYNQHYQPQQYHNYNNRHRHSPPSSHQYPQGIYGDGQLNDRAFNRQVPVPARVHNLDIPTADTRNNVGDPSQVILENLPKGVTSATLENPSHQRPTTANTVDSALAMGVSFPNELRPKPSRQQLLPNKELAYSNDDLAAIELNSQSTAYSPPAQPSASTTQYSTSSQLSRNKTIKDRYGGRNAGGESGMGECCETCCGGCMRCSCCACCSMCCCLGPIISWILVLLVLVGIALALYFNWGKITNAIKHDQNKTDTTQPAATPAPTIISSTVPAAARDLLQIATAIASSVISATSPTSPF
ncbi:hypothetical protein BX070DRAFT_236136 [Coemansia spiralis]|nr:hypothetical protein BX070DRAFT_236136 [Coemansia spiralis]